jgi:hypothetical protein
MVIGARHFKREYIPLITRYYQDQNAFDKLYAARAMVDALRIKAGYPSISGRLSYNDFWGKFEEYGYDAIEKY